MHIRENVELRSLTNFRIGGAARYLALAENADEAKEAIAFAKERSLPYIVLSGGSNVLVSDRGYDGVVIHMKIEHRDWSEDDTLAVVGAGVSWDAFVADAVARGRYGVENLSGIPGSVGGATVGNIGAYGSEAKDTILWVEALDPIDQRVVRFDNAACRFAYRHSLFKEDEGKRSIVTSVAFRLAKDAPLNKGYKDIVQFEEEQGTIATLAAMRAAILAIRARKFPKEGTVGNAGSFFKNPVVAEDVASRFLERFPDAPVHDAQPGMKKLSAAWIIDRVLKMRGARDGAVGTWESQALVLINHGDAKASDVARFAKRISDACDEEIGIALSPEVVFIGEIESE